MSIIFVIFKHNRLPEHHIFLFIAIHNDLTLEFIWIDKLFILF
jgi:hypothetical protein